jgi:hypothetical protein
MSNDPLSPSRPPAAADDAAWTKGHKVPVLHGGTDDLSNLQAECYQCNFRKNAARVARRSAG